MNYGCWVLGAGLTRTCIICVELNGKMLARMFSLTLCLAAIKVELISAFSGLIRTIAHFLVRLRNDSQHAKFESVSKVNFTVDLKKSTRN